MEHALREFYRLLLRTFNAAGVAATHWVSSPSSLLQGCPFSTMLIAGIMLVFLKATAVPGADRNVFMDDRICWTIASRHLEAVRRMEDVGPRGHVR